jgi:hypothetical protein
MSAKPKKTDGNGGRDSNGKFVRGNSGKPKGAANHTTKAMRKMLLDFLHNKFDEVCGLWDELETRDKLTLYLQLSRLVIPKPETEYEERHEGLEINITRQIITRESLNPPAPPTPPIAWITADKTPE